MSSVWSVILAQAHKPRPDLWQSPLFLTCLALVAALLLGAVVIALVDRWRKRSRPQGPALGSGDQLSHFRSLYDRGELSREEFEQIRAKLGAKLRQEMKIAPRTDAPANDAPSPGPEPLVRPEKPGAEPPQPPEPPAPDRPSV